MKRNNSAYDVVTTKMNISKQKFRRRYGYQNARNVTGIKMSA